MIKGLKGEERQWEYVLQECMLRKGKEGLFVHGFLLIFQLECSPVVSNKSASSLWKTGNINTQFWKVQIMFSKPFLVGSGCSGLNENGPRRHMCLIACKAWEVRVCKLTPFPLAPPPTPSHVCGIRYKLSATYQCHACVPRASAIVSVIIDMNPIPLTP